MKTTISPDGTLTIKPETELEAYALGQWCKTSFTEPTNEAPSQFVGKLHVTGGLDKTPAVTPYSGQSAIQS